MKIILIFCVLSTIAFSQATIAVKALKTGVLSVQEAESVTNFITNELFRLSRTDKVIAWSDLEEIIKQIGESSELASLATDDSEINCLNDKCLQELGGALGVEKILVTDITKVGSSTIVNMRVIDLLLASSSTRNSLRVSNGIDEILDGVPELLKGLGFGKGKQAEQNNQKLSIKKNEDLEKIRKEKGAVEAAKEATVIKEKRNRKLRAWLRYSGLGLGVVGGFLAYKGERWESNANMKAIGLASLGLLSVGVSFTF
jgi:hypothetical protein